jgi:hypothetical protein
VTHISGGRTTAPKREPDVNKERKTTVDYIISKLRYCSCGIPLDMSLAFYKRIRG